MKPEVYTVDRPKDRDDRLTLQGRRSPRRKGEGPVWESR